MMNLKKRSHWLTSTCLLVSLSLSAIATLAQPAQPARYIIDQQSSDLHWRVYSAGVLSGLGHNHVISAGELNGFVLVYEAPELSRFELEIPVAALLVDDPELRARYGADFASQPSSSDISGTRTNMLSPRLLHAEEFPLIKISGTVRAATSGTQQTTMKIEIVGKVIEMELPAELHIDAATLTATGNFELSHEALGLRPFSALLGSLRVDEQLDFTFRFTAGREVP